MNRRHFLSIPWIATIARPLWAAKKSVAQRLRPARWGIEVNLESWCPVRIRVIADGREISKIVFPPQPRRAVWVGMPGGRPKVISISMESLGDRFKLYGFTVSG